jgi:hypothetical protein
MHINETSNNELIKLGIMLILSAVLAACAPTPAEQETQSAVTQTIIASETVVVSPTPEASFTPENTPTITATATPENTPTPKFTATPEAMTQEEIRAEILAAGVNLDDLANSQNEWVKNHLAIEVIQDDIDNHNFGTENENNLTTVVIGLEAVENLDELEQALLTDGGWKLTTFAKLAYKDINGDWQIIKVPLNAYHAEDDLFWIKNVGSRSAPNFMKGTDVIQPDENGNFILPLIRTWISLSTGQNYHYGTGSFIRISTALIGDPKYPLYDCDLDDPPRYSEEELIEFRRTGDPSIFGYQDSDGYYILWPLVTFSADLSELSNYDIQE